MGFIDAPAATVLAVLEVMRTAQISPNVRRITVGGEDLAGLPDHGFDHWFRLFLPREHGETSFALPDRVDLRGYLKYLRMPSATRPHLRNYTVREFRPEQRELDIDFVVHGDEGIATRWAMRTGPGDRIALLDQGTGFKAAEGANHHLLVSDETGMFALINILRDLPRAATGHAYIEIPDAADAQPTQEPDGMTVHWLPRPAGVRHGDLALDTVTLEWRKPSEPVSAYLVGEQKLPTTLRRWLVAEQGVPKSSIVFAGYWRLGKAH